MEREGGQKEKKRGIEERKKENEKIEKKEGEKYKLLISGVPETTAVLDWKAAWTGGGKEISYCQDCLV